MFVFLAIFDNQSRLANLPINPHLESKIMLYHGTMQPKIVPDNPTLGFFIKSARLAKNYSQKQLAELTGLNFTYLSKIENDKTDYPPTERVIIALARELDLDAEELIFLTGKIPQSYQQFTIENYDKMPALFKKLRNDPDQLKKIIDLPD